MLHAKNRNFTEYTDVQQKKGLAVWHKSIAQMLYATIKVLSHDLFSVVPPLIVNVDDCKWPPVCLCEAKNKLQLGKELFSEIAKLKTLQVLDW